ncbi:MAG TPA: sugar ABC transporter substrate-binding protein [Limnochordia bacterium]
MRTLRRALWAGIMLTIGFGSLGGFALRAAAGEAPVVRFWTWWAVEDEDLAKMSAAIGAEVAYQQLPWGEFLDKLIVSVLGNDSPDLIYIDPAWFDAFAEKGTLTDLGPFIRRDDQRLWRDVFPAGMDLWNIEGRQLAVPNNLSPSFFWYNATMLNQLGLARPTDSFSWQQWLEYSRKATADSEGDGLPDQMGFTPWWWQIVNLIWSNGAELFRDGELAHDTPEFREALRFYRQFRELDLIADWNQLAHKGFAEHPDLAWSAGLILFAPGGDWIGPVTVRDGASGDWRFEAGVAHEPLSPKGTRAALLRGNGLGIPVTAKHPELAFALIRYLLSDENQTKIGVEGQMPARRSIALESYLTPQSEYPYRRETVIASLAYQRGPDKGVNWSQSYERWDSPIKAQINRYINGEIGLEEAVQQITLLTPPVMEAR